MVWHFVRHPVFCVVIVIIIIIIIITTVVANINYSLSTPIYNYYRSFKYWIFSLIFFWYVLNSKYL